MLFIGKFNNKNAHINIYKEENKFRKYYKLIKLNDFFLNNKNITKKEGLHFGFICPGAVSTVKYLNENENEKNKNIISKIKLLTDFQFFIEIIVLYNKYLDKKIYNKLNNKLGGNHCELSKKITQNITTLFNSLEKHIRDNIPDNFYHVRHNTLICSNDANLAEQRIKLIKNIYSKEQFNINQCINKKDGISGCRDCCRSCCKNNYQKCVNLCMNN